MKLYLIRLSSIKPFGIGLYALACFCSMGVYAQNHTYEWASAFQGKADAVHCAYDPFGNLYVTGGFRDSISFGSQKFYVTDTVEYDLYLAKLDSTGNVIWAMQGNTTTWPGARGLKIETDNAGNVFVAGLLANDITVQGNHIQKHPGAYSDMFLLKLDSAGNLIWHKQSYGDIGSCMVKSMTVDNQGDVIVSGTLSAVKYFDNDSVSTMNSSCIFFVKYHANGTLAWTNQIDASDFSNIRGITTDSENDIYCTGQLTSAYFGNEFYLAANGTRRIVLAKLSSFGTFIWAKWLNEPQHYDAYASSIDFWGNSVFITGGIVSQITIFGGDTIPVIGTSGNKSKHYTARFDTSGNLQWFKFNYGSYSSGNINVSESGIITSFSGGLGTVYVGDTIFNFNSGGQFFVQYDHNGNQIYVEVLNSKGANYSDVDAFKDRLAIVGGLYDTLYLPGYTLTTLDHPTAYSCYVFQIRDPKLSVGINEKEVGFRTFKIFPNPASSHLTLEADFIQYGTTAVIFDLLGREVCRFPISERKTQIRIENLPDGIYITSIPQTGFSQKFIKCSQ